MLQLAIYHTIMKLTISLFLAMVITVGFFCQSFAQISPSNTTEIKSSKTLKNKGEKIFIKHADECIAIIERAALKMSVSGVMIIAFIPGEITSTWISKIKVESGYILAVFSGASGDQDVAAATEGMDYLYPYFLHK